MQVFELLRQQGGKAPGHDLAPLLHLYKARLALACHNHKAAKKEVGGRWQHGADFLSLP